MIMSGASTFGIRPYLRISLPKKHFFAFAFASWLDQDVETGLFPIGSPP